MNGLGRAGRKAVLGATLLLGAADVRAAGPVVEIRRSESGHEVAARFEVPVDPLVAWDVLSDYESMPRFVSSIKSSRILRRDESGVLLEQEARGRLLFVSRSVKLRLAVTERRPRYLGFSDIDAVQFARYDGAWRVEPSSGGSTVSYSLTAQPDPSLAPEFAAGVVLRRSARRLMQEVRAEMLRRKEDAGRNVAGEGD